MLNQSRYAYLKLLIKIIFTISVILFITSLLDFKMLFEGLKKVSVNTFLQAALFCFLSSLCQAVRWCYMTKDQVSTSYFRQILMFWKASFFNLITPAALGGDIYRIATSQKTKQGSTALGLIVRERVLGLAGFFLFYIIFLILLQFKNDTTPLPSFFMSVGMLALIGLIILAIIQMGSTFLIKISSRYVSLSYQNNMTDIANAIRYKKNSEILILGMLTSFSIINWALVFYVLASALNYSSIKFEETALISITTEISRWIPITLQGVGLRETAAAYTFNLLNYSLETGFLTAGLAYIINTFILLANGLISFLISCWLAYQNINTSLLGKGDKLL